MSEISHYMNAIARRRDEAKRLRVAGEVLASVLHSTLYSPPGFSGPPVWWDNQARTAIKMWRDAANRESVVTTD